MLPGNPSLISDSYMHVGFWKQRQSETFSTSPSSLNDSWSLETSAEWHLVFFPPSLAVASRRAAATSSAAPSPRTTSNMAASVREKQTGSFNCFFFIKACFQRRTAAGTGCREFKRPSVCRRRFIQNCHPDKQLTNRSLSRVAAAGADD